jgi:hypothetical protein
MLRRRCWEVQAAAGSSFNAGDAVAAGSRGCLCCTAGGDGTPCSGPAHALMPSMLMLQPCATGGDSSCNDAL